MTTFFTFFLAGWWYFWAIVLSCEAWDAARENRAWKFVAYTVGITLCYVLGTAMLLHL